MNTVQRRSTLFLFLALLLVQCSAVTMPQPGEVFADRLSSGEPGPEMVVLPAGEFLMGCFGTPLRPDAECHGREEPIRRVKIPRPFAVSKYEVTFEDYDRFTGATGRADDYGWGRGRRPAINVSWPEAQAYVEWLSRETGATYRLLSETEWEYAARAGSSARLDWGDNKANCGSCGSQWDGEQSAPAGSFPANSWGLHDMLGNVDEWVQDCWNGDYIGAPSDGTAWIEGNCERRVVRGGNWMMGGAPRIPVRNRWPAGLQAEIVGFRVARTLGR